MGATRPDIGSADARRYRSGADRLRVGSVAKEANAATAFIKLFNAPAAGRIIQVNGFDPVTS
jgi:hypothetical protein